MEEDADKARFLGGVPPADLAGELEDEKGKTLPELHDVVDVLGQEFDGDLLRAVEKHEEGVPASANVSLGEDEPLHQLGGVGDQVVPEELVDVEEAKRGVLADVRVAVLKALQVGGGEGLEKFELLRSSRGGSR